MKQYDPVESPDPQQWLALAETERIRLVQDYHRRARIHLPNERIHAAIHAAVENQIAAGDELPVKRKLYRLMADGLDRHDAVHAIGAVLTNFMHDVLNNGTPDDTDPNPAYFAAVERLTVDDWLRSASEPTTEDMAAAQILDALADDEPFPIEAIRAAGERRASMAPVFTQAIDQHLAGETNPSVEKALFFIFHLLGEWREKSAYRSLARLLRRPAHEIGSILGDAITETSHRVMAAVFDGNPTPLYDVILDPQADEFIRSRMCEVLAMVTVRDELPRTEVARFLRACYSELEPRYDCFVWQGWQSAIAMLGLVELEPLVKQAFERGHIDRSWLRLEHFQEDLRRAIEISPASWVADDEFSLFGDTIDELSTWAGFRPDDEKSEERYAGGRSEPWSPSVPAVNPLKGVGRNDPCPCGSGKKFKKCCLDRDHRSPLLASSF